jgi:hypothetical protein
LLPPEHASKPLAFSIVSENSFTSQSLFLIVPYEHASEPLDFSTV